MLFKSILKHDRLVNTNKNGILIKIKFKANKVIIQVKTESRCIIVEIQISLKYGIKWRF